MKAIYKYVVQNNFGEHAELTTPGIAWKVFNVLRKYSRSCQIIKINVDDPDNRKIIADWED